MLLRLRFTRPGHCSGHDFQQDDELVTDTEQPTVFFAIHRLAPVWREVVDLQTAGTVEEVNDPLPASEVVRMVERRVAERRTESLPQTG
jgi:mRNA degradation ribonuclease J1/J2